jgi:Na+/melibiose symporter-like transporter
LTRLLDALADPCFGWMIDRYRRKPVLFASLLPFALGFIALFTLPLNGFNPAIWLFAALACCTLSFSAAMIAYQAWGGDMGVDTAERLRLTGAREAFIMAGVVIAAMIPTAVADDPLVGMVWLPFFLIAFVLLAIPVICGLPAGHQIRNEQSLTARLGIIWSDQIYRRLLLVFMANGIASAFPATLFVFYVADVLQTPARTGLLLATYFFTAALAVPIWVRIAQWIGRPRTWLFSMILAMVAFVGAAFLGAGDWLGFLAVCVVSGAAVGTDLTLPASMVADLGEKQGATGIYFGLWNLVAKINLALGAGIALPLLSLLGYTPGSIEHNDVLVAAYVLLPLSLKSIAMVLLYRWRRALDIVT